MDIGERIAHRLKEERKRRGWSLDELAARSQVSRAMISKIERQASTPTAVLLARLADALGLTLSALMFEPRANARSVTALAEQAQWTDPASGYTRRLVSPAVQEGDVEIVAVELPAGARVGFDDAETIRIDGQLLLLEGSVELAFAAERLTLRPGDCARIALHRAHELRNPGSASARYLVVIRRFGPVPKKPASRRP
jgi:transcriptional regulator with XRE-family HTH domain